jgi:hypothetical protein
MSKRHERHHTAKRATASYNGKAIRHPRHTSGCAFDRITAIAAWLFGVPISIIIIDDHDRIWFKSHHGVDIPQVGRNPGLCAAAILRDELWILTDAKIWR